MRYTQNTSEQGLALLQKLQDKEYIQFVRTENLIEIERLGFNNYQLKYRHRVVANFRYKEVRQYIAKLYPKHAVEQIDEDI